MEIHQLTSLLGQREALSLQDQFRYPPYIAEVSLQGHNYPGLHSMQQFWLIGLHAHPGNVPAELSALADVYFALNKMYIQQNGVHSTLNALILGDLNADGAYLTTGQALYCKLCTNRFHWLIRHEHYTNVRLTRAYDRQVSVVNIQPK